MKGSWVTTFAVGGVILLLTLFLGLQYTWLHKAGEATRERMQRRVEADARNFAADLNREVHAAYFNFQTDSDAWEKADWTEFNKRYDYWKSSTQYPGLIREFVYFGKNAPRPLRYDPAARSFVVAEIPSNILALERRFNDPENYKTFYQDEFAFAMPIHRPEREFDRIVLRRTSLHEPPLLTMPESAGYLVILLDKAVFSDRILPDLTMKHFPDGDFRVSVNSDDEQPIYASAQFSGKPDAAVEMFNLTPDRMFFLGDRGQVAQFRTERREPGVVVQERVESQTFSRTEITPDGVKEGRFTIEVKPTGGETPAEPSKVRTSVLAAKTDKADQWTLNVQHVAGSLDNFADNEFNKYFAAGLGLYVLLVGAIVAIVLSALRSKRFAQRQIDFVSSVSHEFRTPLAVIYSASENLADGVASDREQVARYGNLIKGEGRKLSAMVEQILQFAGARSGKRKYNFSPTRPSEVVAAAVAECGPILDENGFAIETEVDENLPAIKIDREALSTALQNLISNSVKYSNGSRWVRVSASNGNGTVKLTVEDRGIGVASDDLKHIFEPFYRARNVVDAQIHGNGLGLALVKEIAEAHGGSVRAKSEIGKGSEFTIELPNA